MSNLPLERERALLHEMFQAGLITAKQHNDRLEEAYLDYRTDLQRARQEDEPDPCDEDWDEEMGE